MKAEDRACFNCEASTMVKIPYIGATSRADYTAICSCRQRLSDHFRHILRLTHVCEWHSDSVCRDDRFPNWRESIEEGI